MLKKNLAKLEKVDLREVWGHEASDFSSWLSLKDNLDSLGNAIGVELKLVQTEANVGRFNVDILAEEESTGKKIIIENQLEDTNHDHLGKIITYASGYDAEIIIWIVKDFKEEHQKALDWLNEHTDENINFFLIKLELWKVGNSDPAPRFELIVSPNEWAKAIKTTTGNREVTDTKLKQLDFWQKFKNYIEQKERNWRLMTPRPQNWYNFSMGNSESHISLTIDTQKNLLACEVYINNNKDLYKYLMNKKEAIEKELKDKADWIEATKATRIVVRKEFDDVLDQNNTDPLFKWLYEKVGIFKNVFPEYIKEYNQE